jgi:hypothetical protein
MEFLLLGAAMGFNIIVIVIKFKSGQFANAVLDIGVFALLTVILGGTLGGMVIATISSAIFSIYLFLSPVKLRD